MKPTYLAPVAYGAVRIGRAVLRNWRLSLLPAVLLLVLPVMSFAQVGIDISVNLAPPELPVYEQPPIPDDGYLWMPGYWAWGDDEQSYYWVPGTWVLAPQPGFLWTPGYWGRRGDFFVWNEGYWGPQIGFYGGVNYGYGYGGRGFEGGYWRGERFFYNRSVVNVGTTNITNVYNKTVVNNVTVTRVSYNGGNGGVQVQATAGELAAAHERRLPRPRSSTCKGPAAIPPYAPARTTAIRRSLRPRGRGFSPARGSSRRKAVVRRAGRQNAGPRR
jgi:hypothetical protein